MMTAAAMLFAFLPGKVFAAENIPGTETVEEQQEPDAEAVTEESGETGSESVSGQEAEPETVTETQKPESVRGSESETEAAAQEQREPETVRESEPETEAVEDFAPASSEQTETGSGNEGGDGSVPEGQDGESLVPEEETRTESGQAELLGVGVTEAVDVSVRYHTHVQTLAWQNWVANGTVSGTSGMSKRLEGIEIWVSGNRNLGVRYTAHCQTYGWLPWSSDGETNGTEGEAKRLEAIKIQLTGSDAAKYDIYYRVHAQSYGWLSWAKNGQAAGTAGEAKRLEAIQIVIMPAGVEAPALLDGVTSRDSRAYISRTGSENPSVPGEDSTNVLYRTHVQTYGWQGWKYNGGVSGTSGQAKRLEGINIELTNRQCSGAVRYRTHVQSEGWQKWKPEGDLSGTSGGAKRLEAIQIELTGEMAERYDVYYRVHAQSYGWMGWTKNGAPAGTAGFGKRLEAIQILLTEKGAPEPGNVNGIRSNVEDGFIKVSNAQEPGQGEYPDPGMISGIPLPIPMPEEEGQDVEAYTYKITPLFPPFNECFYVETDNPNPKYVRFVDKDSVYCKEGEEPCTLVAADRRFLDVQYENRITGRVKGGYIFMWDDGKGTDGEEFVLQKKTETNYRIGGAIGWYTTAEYKDTPVTVSCPAVKSSAQYLIDEYTTPGADFFKNMDAVQKGLENLSIYPKTLQNTKKRNEYHPYPRLMNSPYPELPLMERYNIYEDTEDRMLAAYVHPYVIDSAGFPALMRTVAKTLAPDCVVENGDYHAQIRVTYQGRSRRYGGAGKNDGEDVIYSKYIETLYRFDGSGGDFAAASSMEAIRSRLSRYAQSTEKELDSLKKMLLGKLRDDAFPGSWLRVDCWSNNSGSCYAYRTSRGYALKDTWVDGRYINECTTHRPGATYEEHPNADILLRNQTYQNYKGETVTGDLHYRYQEKTDTWKVTDSNIVGWQDESGNLPRNMYLTRAQVDAMDVDRNTKKEPESGLIYNGKVEPGTPF